MSDNSYEKTVNYRASFDQKAKTCKTCKHSERLGCSKIPRFVCQHPDALMAGAELFGYHAMTCDLVEVRRP